MSAPGSDKSKSAKEKEQESKRHVVTNVLELQYDMMNHETVSNMAARYAKQTGYHEDKLAFKLDLLRMLAMYRLRRKQLRQQHAMI